MPPKIKVTKKMLLDSAISLIREEGFDALGVRSLACRAGCSTQPIFSNFESLEDLKREVLDTAYEIYEKHTKDEMESGKYPAYKASGMAYISFARKESRLFSALFMREDGAISNKAAGEFVNEAIVPLVMKNLGISEDEAKLLHLEMWAFVHGVAVMVATSYCTFTEELISQMTSDVYQGTAKYLKENSGK